MNKIPTWAKNGLMIAGGVFLVAAVFRARSAAKATGTNTGDQLKSELGYLVTFKNPTMTKTAA